MAGDAEQEREMWWRQWAERQVKLSPDNAVPRFILTALDELTTLRARLAAARGEALEEAARVAESWPSATYGPHAGPTTRTVAERIAACIRIRALPRDGTGVG